MNGDNPYKVSKAYLALVDDEENNEYVVSAFYSFNNGEWFDTKYEQEINVTHLMPLPTPPKK